MPDIRESDSRDSTVPPCYVNLCNIINHPPLCAILFRRKAGELLVRVTSPKLHTQYARAREADGMYKEAARAYEKAKEHENAVRYKFINTTWKQ